MIDFHTHILPEMDDGSESVEESIQMLELSAGQGVKWMVATPHFYADREDPKTFLEGGMKLTFGWNRGLAAGRICQRLCWERKFDTTKESVKAKNCKS